MLPISSLRSYWLHGVYRLLNDVTIPNNRGSTTQIDHIILSIFGIFVVETKYYSGWIFGSAKSKRWTQVVYREKNSFQNPLHQNYGHICALADLLGIPKNKFHGVVCIMGGAEFKMEIPKGVFLGGGYISYIESFMMPVLSVQQVESFRERIEGSMLERGAKTNRLHVQNLWEAHEPTVGATGHLMCPRCGSPMVLRTARKGRNAGTQFYGCSTYPSCKNTVSI